MKDSESRELRRRFASQNGLITRAQLRALGVDSRIERRKIQSGEWARAGKTVIRLASHRGSPEQRLLAACLGAGPAAMASHQSAAWLWGLLEPPQRPSIVVPRELCPSLPWCDVHRTSVPPSTLHQIRGIPVTDPLRTLVDLAAVVGSAALDAALDRALAGQLVSVEGLLAEVDRLSCRGRRGTARMRENLRRRGMTDAPNPSVLESRFLRLLQQSGVQPVSLEVRAGPGGRYRLDSKLSEEVAVEVDGHAYHHSPEQKAEDERRRNRLRLSGLFVLVYTWRDVTYDGQRVVAEIREALRLSQLRARRRGA